MFSSSPVLWQLPSFPIDLQERCVHIWRIDLSVSEKSEIGEKGEKGLIDLLDADEKHRAARFVSFAHRQRFIKAHAGLRKVLSFYARKPAAALKFAYGTKGKPMLPEFPSIQFNLSHTENMALCAVTHHTSLGIDVEYTKRKLNSLTLAKRFFTQAEYQALCAINPAQKRLLAFYQVWTNKEALVKALGVGLSLSLENFTFDVANGKLLETRDENINLKQWEFHGFSPLANYTAALALQRLHNQLSFFNIETLSPGH